MKLGKIGREDAHPLIADTPAARRRVEQARRCRAWVEVDRADLVERERGYLVHADNDEAFQVYRGAAFSPSGEIVSDTVPLRFYVDEDGTVVVLELQPDSWSELTYQAARR